METLNPPGLVTKTNNNTDMISYTAMLTKDTALYDLKKYPNKTILKTQLHRLIRHQCNKRISNTCQSQRNKQNRKIYEHTRDAMGIAIDTPTIATITNADNISTLLDKKQQDRTSECHRNHL